ncbi:hypothetical protein ASPNIDRAFT_39408 [Aspergillus niger ATCC 1015]|uniref:Uncharacterized protein n=1 Tax=Aspergillus niger (strain ATCC 1015 / CBS 113.46 / FGSC A1144 / LSHB Ac4 / NCTC 3858a / NRRL 328 / USDA 3528.7) TaxID=380704 RepID=G3YBG0_ASPNA|nr:hypothetical protein ASPNIDRAFT_39408 [Aspergillus niger ATCC 1015]
MDRNPIFPPPLLILFSELKPNHPERQKAWIEGESDHGDGRISIINHIHLTPTAGERSLVQSRWAKGDVRLAGFNETKAAQEDPPRLAIPHSLMGRPLHQVDFGQLLQPLFTPPSSAASHLDRLAPGLEYCIEYPTLLSPRRRSIPVRGHDRVDSRRRAV